MEINLFEVSGASRRGLAAKCLSGGSDHQLGIPNIVLPVHTGPGQPGQIKVEPAHGKRGDRAEKPEQCPERSAVSKDSELEIQRALLVQTPAPWWLRFRAGIASHFTVPNEKNFH